MPTLVRLFALAVTAFCLAVSTSAQNTEWSPTPVVRTIPAQGAKGVAPDRETSVFFARAVRETSITNAAIFATAGGTPIAATLRQSFDRKVVTLDYTYFLPGDTAIDVTIDGDQLIDANGMPIDADGDGNPGGTLVLSFNTGPELPMPMTSGTAEVTGFVFDENGAPMQGAVIEGWLFPRIEGSPPLPVPAGISNAAGFFTYTTPQFTGTETFLIVIHRPGYSEAIRRVEILAGGCTRVIDAALQPVAPRQMVMAATGGMVMDPTGQIELVIPPGALQQNSNVGVTLLDSSTYLRDDLPELVAEGSFIDVAGVFGEATLIPVTLRLPNIYDLPVGTRVPFGKVDHNTLEWSDLRDLYTGPLPIPDSYLGEVKDDGNGGTFIEIQFDKFCSICTGYCLPFPCPNPSPPPPPPPPPPGCQPNQNQGNSVVDVREGFLRETVELPGFQEREGIFSLSLGYFSGAADPSATLQTVVDYDSTRPVERTLARFEVEGQVGEAAYEFTRNDIAPIATFLWNGTDGLGRRVPTGSYPYHIRITSLNARTAIALPATFGAASVQTFANTYPGLTELRAPDLEGRVVLVNLQDSAFGAGWRIEEIPQLYFDADGCFVLVENNSQPGRYVPSATTPNLWESPTHDASTMVFNPATAGFVRTFPNGDRQVFDQTGLCTSLEDRYGNATSMAWSGGRLMRVASPTGFTYDFAYDGAGKLMAVADSAGRTTNVTVDANGDLASLTDATGATRTFAYDSAHRLIGQTKPRGERSEYAYDTGRVVEARAFDTDGTTLLRRRGFEPSVLDGELNRSLAQGLGSLLTPIPLVTARTDRVIDGNGVSTTLESDDNWQTSVYTDEIGRELRYLYHPDRRSAGWINPNGTRLDFTYDSKGNLTNIANRRSNNTVYSTRANEYNGPFATLSRSVDEENKQTLYEHDPLGNVLAITNHAGGVKRYVYGDARFPSLPTAVIDEAGVVQTLGYDAHGNVAEYVYFPDPAGNPAGETVAIDHDLTGHVRSVTDATNARTLYARDAFNRVTALTEPTTGVVAFDYGDAGCGCATNNLTRVTFQNSQSIAFRYDGLDRLIERTDQFGASTNYTYDPEGNLLRVVNRAGEQIDYEYDDAGQLIRKVLDNDEIVLFQYDVSGVLSAAADPICSLQYVIDDFGRPTQATTILDLPVGGGQPQGLAHTLTYGYDRLGGRTSVQDSFGIGSATYTHDDLHRLTDVALNDRPGTGWTFSYDPAGRRLLEIPRPTGAASAYAYDSAGQLTGILHQTTPMLGIAYGYDAAGRVTTEDRASGMQSLTRAFAYDQLGQLTLGFTSRSFGDVRAAATYAHDNADRLQSDDLYSYTYDAEGRPTQRVRIGSTLTDTFTWDAESRLRQVEQTVDVGGSPQTVMTVRYCYDPLGRRIEKDVNGVVTRYVWDEDQVLHEVDFWNRIDKTYVHGDEVDRPLALIDSVSDQVVHYHQDRLESVVGLSDPTGALVQEYVWDEFGALLDESDPSYFQPVGFAGRERDPEVGLTYNRARYLDPTPGRFLTEDPVGIDGGLNLYGYVGNSPTNLRDPSGLSPFDACRNACDAAHGRMCRAGEIQECADRNRCRQRCNRRRRCSPESCYGARTPLSVAICFARTAWRCRGN